MNKPPKITNEQAHQVMGEMNFQEQVIVRLMMETGLRVTDVLNLRRKDIKDGTIRQKKTKKLKNLELNCDTQRVLENYTRDYYISDLLFPQKRDPGNPINRSTFYRALQRAGNNSGVQVSPHSFRKLYAQNTYTRTGDIYEVQKLMQHKYVETTAGYLDIDVQELIRATVATVDDKEAAHQLCQPAADKNGKTVAHKAIEWLRRVIRRLFGKRG
jgi:integrase